MLYAHRYFKHEYCNPMQYQNLAPNMYVHSHQSLSIRHQAFTLGQNACSLQSYSEPLHLHSLHYYYLIIYLLCCYVHRVASHFFEVVQHLIFNRTMMQLAGHAHVHTYMYVKEQCWFNEVEHCLRRPLPDSCSLQVGIYTSSPFGSLAYLRNKQLNYSHTTVGRLHIIVQYLAIFKMMNRVNPYRISSCQFDDFFTWYTLPGDSIVECPCQHRFSSWPSVRPTRPSLSLGWILKVSVQLQLHFKRHGLS